MTPAARPAGPRPRPAPAPGLRRCLLQPRFPAVLGMTAGPERGRVGAGRREDADTHLSPSGPPHRGHPLPLARGSCRSLRACGVGGGGAVVTIGQE